MKLLVVVEGQTEEIFVNHVLQPYLEARGVFAEPTIVETRHLPGRPRDKGGLSNWSKARRDIDKRLRDSSATTTTLFDFYGLPDDFPGNGEPRSGDPHTDVVRVEAAMSADFNNPRFLPFLALYEFETWVFASPSAVSKHYDQPGLEAQLNGVVASFRSIEHINGGPNTHPSRRLETMIPNYKKSSDGPAILEAIGLAQIRRQCAHFNSWLERLERLGP